MPRVSSCRMKTQEPAESEELVSEFREFIEGIRPEDFES